MTPVTVKSWFMHLLLYVKTTRTNVLQTNKCVLPPLLCFSTWMWQIFLPGHANGPWQCREQILDTGHGVYITCSFSTTSRRGMSLWMWCQCQSYVCSVFYMYVRCNHSISFLNDKDRMIKVSYFFFVVTLLLQASAPLLMSPRMFLPARCLACSSAWSERGRVRSPQSPSHTQPAIRCAWQPGSLLGLVIRWEQCCRWRV